jgi:hypothetical protein
MLMFFAVALLCCKLDDSFIILQRQSDRHQLAEHVVHVCFCNGVACRIIYTTPWGS